MYEELIKEIEMYTEKTKIQYELKLKENKGNKQEKKFLTMIHDEHMKALDKFSIDVINIIRNIGGLPTPGKFNTFLNADWEVSNDDNETKF